VISDCQAPAWQIGRQADEDLENSPLRGDCRAFDATRLTPAVPDYFPIAMYFAFSAGPSFSIA
jgi:hypothetical protein